MGQWWHLLKQRKLGDSSSATEGFKIRSKRQLDEQYKCEVQKIGLAWHGSGDYRLKGQRTEMKDHGRCNEVRMGEEQQQEAVGTGWVERGNSKLRKFWDKGQVLVKGGWKVSLALPLSNEGSSSSKSSQHFLRAYCVPSTVPSVLDTSSLIPIIILQTDIIMMMVMTKMTMKL